MGKSLDSKLHILLFLDINNKPIKLLNSLKILPKNLNPYKKYVLTGLFISEKLILDIPENDKITLQLLVLMIFHS